MIQQFFALPHCRSSLYIYLFFSFYSPFCDYLLLLRHSSTYFPFPTRILFARLVFLEMKCQVVWIYHCLQNCRKPCFVCKFSHIMMFQMVSLSSIQYTIGGFIYRLRGLYFNYNLLFLFSAMQRFKMTQCKVVQSRINNTIHAYE